MLATVTALLTALLNNSAEWFLVAGDEDSSLGGGGNKNNTTDKFFLDALLAQIHASLDHPRLVPASLKLLRRLVVLCKRSTSSRTSEFLPKRRKTTPTKPSLKDLFEHAKAYECLDRVGDLLTTTDSLPPALVPLAGQLFLDFLLDQLHDPRGLEKRIQKLVACFQSRSNAALKQILNTVYSLVQQCDRDVLKKWHGAILLGCVGILTTNEDKVVRGMVSCLIKGLAERVRDVLGEDVLRAEVFGGLQKVAEAEQEQVGCLVGREGVFGSCLCPRARCISL